MKSEKVNIFNDILKDLSQIKNKKTMYLTDDSGITVDLRFLTEDPRFKKMINKMHGKDLAIQIAYGRKATKVLLESYGINNELDQRQD